MRDDFSKKTRRLLASRSGNACSVPDCRLSTEGATLGDDDRVTDVGIAAHITAASPGGPRFDPALSAIERKSAGNGIWCCAVHGRQIDTDHKAFTVERLREWKRGAEHESAAAILTLQRRVVRSPAEHDAAELAFVATLRLPAADNLPTVLNRLRTAARADVDAFKRALKAPQFPVELNLRLLDSGRTSAFRIAGLAAAIPTFNEIAIVAPPGTGKTTTLLQVTGALIDVGDMIPVFVPLGEWSSQPHTLLQMIIHRAAFAGETEGHLRLLAVHGRLTLVLDGWNELDLPARRRLRAELGALQRDFPQMD